MASTGLELVNMANMSLGWPRLNDFEDTNPRSVKMQTLLNRILAHMGNMFNWRHLRHDSYLITTPEYNTGTVLTINNGNNAVVFTGTSFTAAFEGRAFQLAGDKEIYRIARVLDAVAVLLDRIYIGPTQVAVAVPFLVAQDRYGLPVDFGRVPDNWSAFFGTNTVEYVDPNEFKQRRRQRDSLLTGEPEIFTIYDIDDNGNPFVWLDPYPSLQRMLPYTYQRVHPKIKSKNDKVLFPITQEELIVETLVYMGQRDYNDDQRVNIVLADFLRKRVEISTVDQDRGQQRLRLTMSKEELGKEIMRHKVNSRGRIDWGTAFDRDLI